MSTRLMSAAVATVATAITCTSWAGPVPSPLHGRLERGPHAVGFTIVTLKDVERPIGPKRDASGRAIDVNDRARSIEVHVGTPPWARQCR